MQALIRRTHEFRGWMRRRGVNKLRRTTAINDGHVVQRTVLAPKVPLIELGKKSLQEDVSVQFHDHESRGRAVRWASTPIPLITPARDGNGANQRQ